MQHTNWFLRPQPKLNPKLRIICFPYAGGSAATYLSWVKWLPDNIELVAIQPPGRGNRMFEPCYSDMGELVNALLNVMPDIINQPYILFGHSLGSRVAFELMVQCQKKELALPSHFIASGSRGPHIRSRKTAIHNLPDRAFIEKLRELNGTPQQILDNKELIALYLPLLRADFKLADNYYFCSETKIDCPISILGGSDDKEITHSDLKSWEDFFSRSADIHIIPGDHFFVEHNKFLVMQRVNIIIKNTLVKLNSENRPASSVSIA